MKGVSFDGVTINGGLFWGASFEDVVLSREINAYLRSVDALEYISEGVVRVVGIPEFLQRFWRGVRSANFGEIRRRGAHLARALAHTARWYLPRF